MDDLMTIGEVAEHLGVSRPRVYKLSARAGFPEALIIDGRRHWRRTDIEKWEATWDRDNRGGRPRTREP